MAIKSDPIPILFVETGAADGGSFESLYQHLGQLNRSLYEPRVVLFSPSSYKEKIEQLDIPVTQVHNLIYSSDSPDWLKKLLKSLTFFIARFFPWFYLPWLRVVHTNSIVQVRKIAKVHRSRILDINDNISRDLFLLFTKEKDREPFNIVSHLRSVNKGRSLRFDDSCAKLANTYVDRFVANSQATSDAWVERGVDEEKINVVHNCIEPQDPEPIDIHKRWDLPDDSKFLIGVVGRLVWWKGHNFLFRTFKKLLKKAPDSFLLIVGEGKQFRKLNRFTEKLGISNRVKFTGYQKHGLNIIASLDLLVVPSQQEPFGRVVLEGMSVKTPVVGTDSGGIPEIIQHEKNGLLIPFGDEEALAEAIIRLREDQHLRKKIIEEANRTVRTRFSIEQYSEKMDKIYEEVVQSKKG